MNLRNVMIGLLITVTATAGAALAAGPAGEEPETATLRIGTFDTRVVALAYGRSDTFMKWVRELKADHRQAKEDGDEERAAELEAQGRGMQEELHRQVFGGTEIDAILEMIADDLPDIAREAGVDMIVGEMLYRAPHVETVDISIEMARPFHPDDETMKIIEEVLKTEPVDPDTINHDH